MKEIEVKAKLKNKKAIMDKLITLGCVFEAPVTQKDVVYVENTGSLETFMSNKAFLRIRVRGDSKILFTVKERMGKLSAIEHEVEISSSEEMEKALAILGYKEAVRINKTRITTHYNGCEICIDEVKDLGTFIEMEKLTKEGNVEEIQEELFRFFESIGISRSDRVTSGYDILKFGV